jgi:argininosuccinate lyase
MSQPFSFIDIADRFCTGSSLMPQKKNPDILEIVRGKTGRVYGDLVALLTVTKGLPMSYDRDLQEDKEPVFDAAETLFSSLQILTAMLPTVTFKRDNCASAVKDSFLLATDWTDYLVRKGMPFREAHGCVGQAVALAVNKGCGLTDLDAEELLRISPLMDEGILGINSALHSVEAKKTLGSTNPGMVKKEIEEWKKFLAEEQKRYTTGSEN